MAQWLSINQAKQLVKQGLYRLETGSNSDAQQIYDKQSGNYVGHIKNGQYYQSPNYQIPQYIIQKFEVFDRNAWDKRRDW
ncbi:MAG: hypothetical protein LBN95_02880 [Prevotellaceae bacterium]|jgi:hypothetical protein|nr:hypothetical protein [Prevotellaceae bacterium]